MNNFQFLPGLFATHSYNTMTTDTGFISGNARVNATATTQRDFNYDPRQFVPSSVVQHHGLHQSVGQPVPYANTISYNIGSNGDQLSVRSRKYTVPEDILHELLCRFILNIPEEEKSDPVRILFQVELAHWFFVDNYCNNSDANNEQKHMIPFNQFAYTIFQAAPYLKQYCKDVDKHITEFRNYRMRVPTYGAILMDQELTKVLLVQGFRNYWGFPKGKVNEVEDPVECAIREVFEETGYDMRPLINPRHYIESKAQDRNDRLYLIRGVDTSYPFFPRTQNEIKTISWFNIDELPEHKKDTNPRITEHPISNFYTIYPYMKRLKLWISDKLEGRNKIECFRSKWFPKDQDEENALLSVLKSAFNNSNLKNSNTKESISFSERTVDNNFSADTKKQKAKRRLFVDETSSNSVETKSHNQLAATFISNAIGIGDPKINSSNSVEKNLSKTSSKSVFSKYTLSSPVWENFSLDKDRLIRAFNNARLS